VASNLLVHLFHKTCQEHVILHFKIIFKSVHKKVQSVLGQQRFALNVYTQFSLPEFERIAFFFL